jgi:hypothetical protein
MSQKRKQQQHSFNHSFKFNQQNNPNKRAITITHSSRAERERLPTGGGLRVSERER